MAQWTMADLAHMTEKAIIMDTMDDNEYCEHCTVAPVQTGDRYCADCLDSMIADMAATWQEDISCSEGLYGTV